MKRTALISRLNAEVARWSKIPFTELIAAVPDVAAFGRGEGVDFHQFEVQLLEKTPDYVHVCVSVDDGSLRHSFAPLTRSFIVYRDGRVEI